MGTLHFEAGTPGGGWRLLAALSEGDREGSISDNGPGGREVILFACLGGCSRVRRSVVGGDELRGAARVVKTLGFEDLAVLRDGESYTMDVVPDTGGLHAVRWTHRA
jgi:hypothetical protein